MASSSSVALLSARSAPHEADIDEVGMILSYNFDNRDHAWEALQAPGSPVDVIGGRVLRRGNELMALLGNRAIAMMVAEAAYEGNWTAGDASNELQRSANRHRLASLGYRLGLDKLVNRNNAQPFDVNEKLMANTVEALIGAVWRDRGYEFARRVVMDLEILQS